MEKCHSLSVLSEWKLTLLWDSPRGPWDNWVGVGQHMGWQSIPPEGNSLKPVGSVQPYTCPGNFEWRKGEMKKRREARGVEWVEPSWLLRLYYHSSDIHFSYCSITLCSCDHLPCLTELLGVKEHVLCGSPRKASETNEYRMKVKTRHTPELFKELEKKYGFMVPVLCCR